MSQKEQQKPTITVKTGESPGGGKNDCWIEDAHGNMYPGQQSATLHCPYDDASTITVKFVIDGKIVKIAGSAKDGTS